MTTPHGDNTDTGIEDEKPMKQVDRADRLFGEADLEEDVPVYLVEYDHPYQRIEVEYSGKVHIVENGKWACTGDQFGNGRDGVLASCRDIPHPCPGCFMRGDLLALRIVKPENTRGEIDEARLQSAHSVVFGVRRKGLKAERDLNGLAESLITGMWRYE
jgi:hypothetical protein